MSIAGGFENAPALGRSIGCDAIQIFTKNANQWRARPIGEDEPGRFKKSLQENDIRAVIAHDTYLINLASPDTALWKRSVAAFAEELTRCRILGITLLVTHPGSHMGKGEDYGISRVAEGLDAAFESAGAAARGVRVLLENTAGQGNGLGYRFEQLAGIIRRCSRKRRLGACLDTAHMFAAGYDLRTPGAWKDTMRALEDALGPGRLAAIHLNDSKKDLGSRVDRHDRVGRGAIGKQGFEGVLADPRVAGLPLILEVPGGMEAFKEDLALLRRLARRKPTS